MSTVKYPKLNIVPILPLALLEGDGHNVGSFIPSAPASDFVVNSRVVNPWESSLVENTTVVSTAALVSFPH